MNQRIELENITLTGRFRLLLNNTRNSITTIDAPASQILTLVHRNGSLDYLHFTSVYDIKMHQMVSLKVVLLNMNQKLL